MLSAKLTLAKVNYLLRLLNLLRGQQIQFHQAVFRSVDPGARNPTFASAGRRTFGQQFRPGRVASQPSPLFVFPP